MAEREHQWREKFLGEKQNTEAFRQVIEAYENHTLHPVVADIVQIALSDSPESHPKRRKLALAVEGGGVAGAVSAYEIGAHELVGWVVFGKDIADCFGIVAASSSGSSNAVYFVKRRAIFAKSHYESHFSKPPFINIPLKRDFPFLDLPMLLNLHRTGVVNIPYLINFIRGDKIGYPEESTGLVLVATLVDRQLPATPEARTVRFKNFSNEDDLIMALQASMSIPFLSSFGPFEYRGMKLFDGGIVEHIPVKTAFGEGAKKVLALTSKPIDTVEDISLGEKFVAAAYSALDPGLTRLWFSRRQRARDTRVWLKNKQLDIEGPNFATFVAPSAETRVKTMETDQNAIRNAGISAATSLLQAFGINDRQVQFELIEKLLNYDTKLIN